ncbi:hypothetical protein M422DRAFT_272758 [Sphaerobolus stellatus SS14]|uniref:Uncharacterized protein n=1 Tax=Sphaerobolus stellatus (strain SS14) TaxID=990650 RepID=A0A0C9ULM9_SPHS4|nr:hypothetical protein M422DRAFT_272758 [Sphaerobolus stellatus SS14]
MTASSHPDIHIKFNSKLEKLIDGTLIKWSREIRMVLRAQQAYKYVEGLVPQPTEPVEKVTCLEINDQIVGALGTIINEPLQRELKSITNAKDAWAKLKEKTQPKGLITQLENMQMAIKNCFSPKVPVGTTIMEICDSLSAIFENGKGPSQDDWLMILLLNALSDSEYDWL